MPSVSTTIATTRIAHSLIDDSAHPSHHGPDADSSSIRQTEGSTKLDDNKNIDKSKQLNGSLSRKEEHSQNSDKLNGNRYPEQHLQHRSKSVQVESVGEQNNRPNEELSEHSSDSGMIYSPANRSETNSSDHQDNIEVTNKPLLNQSLGDKHTVVTGQLTRSTKRGSSTGIVSKAISHESTTPTRPAPDQASALSGLRISQPGKLDGIYASQTAERTSFGRASIDSLRGSRSVNYFLVTGLPTLVLIMSSLVLCLIFKVCRAHCDKPKRKSTNSGNRSGRLRVVCPSLEKEPADSREGPVSFISGGKVIDGLKSIQVLCKDGKSVNRGDTERLTPDMDDNSNDSDEQPAKQSSLAFWKSGKKKSQKFPGDVSGEETVVKSYGQIKFKIVYDFDSATLAVSVLEAKDLAVMDLNGYSDPYVRVYLMPDCKRKYEKTRVHKKTLNPIFNETFTFQVSYGELMSKTLVLAVYDFDRFSKHDEIGQISIPIGSIDLARSVEEWRQLESITDSTNDQVSRRAQHPSL